VIADWTSRQSCHRHIVERTRRAGPPVHRMRAGDGPPLAFAHPETFPVHLLLAASPLSPLHRFHFSPVRVTDHGSLSPGSHLRPADDGRLQRPLRCVEVRHREARAGDGIGMAGVRRQIAVRGDCGGDRPAAAVVGLGVRLVAPDKRVRTTLPCVHGAPGGRISERASRKNLGRRLQEPSEPSGEAPHCGKIDAAGPSRR
jgi:hypothetical protein